MTKKFITGLMLASMLPVAASAATIEELQAQIAALMSQLAAAKPTTSAACSYVFTKTLTSGMSDTEVMNLQKVLNMDVATQVTASGVGSAGNETMYFGPATKAAVVKFQNKYASEVLAPAGLSAGTGLVGAATRAKLNTMCSTVTTPTTPTTPGNTTPVTGLNGGAGSMTLTSYSSDTEDEIATGDSENVLGFKIQADGSDLKITHVKLSVDHSGSNSTYLNRYFSKFEISANGTKVATVDAEDFIRDNAGEYSKTIALDNAIVRMGSDKKVTFYVKAYAISSIDTANVSDNWAMTVSNIRFADATGVILSDTDTVSVSGINVTKLATSGDVKIKLSAGSAMPEQKVVFVSDDNSGDKVTMNEFKVKAEGTDVTFDTLTATVTPGTVNLVNAVSEFQLVRGTEILATVDGASSTVAKAISFDLDTPVKIAQDETVTFKIVAKMLKVALTGSDANAFEQGDTMMVSVESSFVRPEDKNGDTVSASSVTGSATGKVQTFRATGLNIAKVSANNIVNSNNTTPNLSYAEFKMQVKVTASGDDIWVPLSVASGTTLGTGVNYNVINASNDTVAVATTETASVSHISGGTRDGSYVKVADGESATLEVVVSFDPSTAGQFKLRANNVGYTLAGATGVATAQIAGTPVQDFESSVSSIQ